MKRIVKIFSPIFALGISLVSLLVWTSNCSSYTTYSYVLKKAGTIPYQAPQIKLTNQFNKKMALGVASPKFRLVNFIYLNCPQACPISVLKMRKIVESCDEGLFSNLEFLSVSFDAKRDTVAKIRTFWEVQGSLSQWGVAMINEVSKTLEKKFGQLGVWVKHDRLGEFSHTNFFFLLDKSSKVVAVFFPEQKVRSILKQIELLVNNSDEEAV